MNENQIDCMLKSLDRLSRGVDKIGDGVKSVATYLWLPFYIIVFLIILVAIGYLMFSLV